MPDEDEVVDELGERRDTVAAGEPHHGVAEPAGQDAVPRSRLFEGRFGRLFRALPAPFHDRAALVALGRALADQAGSGRDNPKIPAGYTYLGQFVDHDITFDPLSLLSRRNDPDALVNFRSPRYDLDSLYGQGPAASPYLYESKSKDRRGVRLLEGRNPDADEAGNPLERRDLLRNRQGRAVIGDPRNDENIIVSQLHHAFVRFHNNVVEHVAAKSPALKGAALFDEARRIVTWHYQWVVVRDFLPKVVGEELAGEVLPASNVPNLKFFQPRDEPFIPVEFSGAAYRFGHSMVRPAYDLNENIREITLFSAAADAEQDHFGHLNGFRPLPVAWTVDWRHFVVIDRSKPQLSRKIDTHLAAPLLKLPTGVSATHRGLPELNLLRGRALELPSGQAVAQAMGVPTVTKLGLDRFGLSAGHRAALEAETPLWYYVLREAENAPRNGQRLGPVGGRIVAEVLVGLLAHDPNGFIRQQPTWKPEGLRAVKAGDFTLGDLLRFATIGQ
jgi:heme peroxidase